MMEPCLLVPLNSKQKHGQSYVIQFAESYFSTFSASVSALTSRPATALDRPTPPSRTRPTRTRRTGWRASDLQGVQHQVAEELTAGTSPSRRRHPPTRRVDVDVAPRGRGEARVATGGVSATETMPCVQQPLLVRYSHKWPRNPRHPAPRCTR